ncbi:MAG: hypothetical protein ACK5Q5_13795 [Planctomycetaceae bacterium]
MKTWLQHAFAIDSESAEPTPDEQRVLEQVCQELVRRRLTTAAVAFLEMARPLNYLGSQSLHFFSPLISAVTQGNDHQHLAALLERRDAIDRMLQRIEELTCP